MWREYSKDFIKNNRASGISIVVGTFVAALFLSFLCSLFYNFWRDNIAGIVLEEGDWEGRITGVIGQEALETINNYANVESAVINPELSEGQVTVVDICFSNVRTIREDMAALTDILGLEEAAAEYHYSLLALYFIRIPGDEAPRLVMPFYLTIVVVVCISMILLIHNSFAVSMSSRIHQFGIFSSIGATPNQILTCLMQETIILAAVPVIAGILAGIALSLGAVLAMNIIGENVAGSREMGFQYHPLILAVTLLACYFTILISAWLPARKISRLTPLEAIRGTGDLQLKKKKRSPILSIMFGVEGELAGNALKAQKRALRTTSLSLTLSFLGFILIQCFFTLSGISTNYTYFARYQDAWDVMVTVQDTRIGDFGPVGEIQGVDGVRSSVIYQLADASCIVARDWQSEELLALGGLEALAGSSVTAKDGFLTAKASILILDNKSFEEYCSQIGITPGLDGAIVVNRIWDSLNSNFRYPEYIPFVKETMDSIALLGSGREDAPAQIPLLAYTRELPVLREEYDDYALLNVIPLSLWEEISGQIGGAEKDTYIRLLAKEGAALEELDALEDTVAGLIGREYHIESENRIRERISNDEIIGAYELVLGAFCVLLAIIGIANVFSNTMGFLRQRKREFARYLSVGLTPEGIRKMFCIEALVLAGRPVLFSLLVSVILIGIMIRASYLDPMEFMAVAPVAPITAFILAVFAFVALAYFIGGRRVMKIHLTEALRDDTMM